MFDGPAPAWKAALALRFSSEDGRTRVASRHQGPLRVQKPLHPEGPELCHAVVLHPPGGIAGGDHLQIDIRVDASAQALVTTPGATRWYKANGGHATQRVALAVDGALEWLPQESIVFDRAQVDSTIEISLAPDARMIGWDLVALGRRAAGERFAQGEFRQQIRLSVAGALQWVERTRIVGSDPLLDSPIGLAGRHVFGCLWAVSDWVDDELDALRAQFAGVAPLTRLSPRLAVARVLAASTEEARAALESAWRALRPLVMRRDARSPRLWAT
jgi:urease accessory protein